MWCLVACASPHVDHYAVTWSGGMDQSGQVVNCAQIHCPELASADNALVSDDGIDWRRGDTVVLHTSATYDGDYNLQLPPGTDGRAASTLLVEATGWQGNVAWPTFYLHVVLKL